MKKLSLTPLYIVITSNQCSVYNCVCVCARIWGEKEKKHLHTHKSLSHITPI